MGADLPNAIDARIYLTEQNIVFFNELFCRADFHSFCDFGIAIDNAWHAV